MHIASPTTYKTEVKYLIPDLSKLPADILAALETGQEHTAILKRGLIRQDYLAVTRKNIFNLYRALTAAGLPLGSEEDRTLFMLPGKTQEIRFMRKFLKVQGAVQTIYQVVIQGSGTISNIKVETPEVLTAAQLDKIKHLFEVFQSEINDCVCKVYFEVPLRYLTDLAGDKRTVEIDIFFKSHPDHLRPFFIDGEIKFHNSTPIQATLRASRFRMQKAKQTACFGLDLTDRYDLKARSIALKGVPSDIKAILERHLAVNQRYSTVIANEFTRWCLPADIQDIIASSADKLLGVYLDAKVLMNAEAFGFGPTAAVAEIFPYMRTRVSHLSYIGTGHTLDLQRCLSYNNVYDCSCTSADSDQCREKFLAIASNYDVFITASDFETANWAKERGLKVIIYDPLTWYWSKIPPIVKKADFYVAQNFFKVTERLAAESELFPEYTVVPAIVAGYSAPYAEDLHASLLVNMGGLSNPYLANSQLEVFAKVIVSAVHGHLEEQFDQTIYVTSKAIAQATQAICPTVTLQPHQVQQYLNMAKLAIMTPGLGNIYEASAMGKKVVWLPPANDSQGQQIQLLREHGMVDAAIDWSDLFADAAIDYNAEQKIVLQQIASCMQRLASEPSAQVRFSSLLEQACCQLQQSELPVLAKLADTFEIHGAKQAAESILQWLVEHKSDR